MYRDFSFVALLRDINQSLNSNKRFNVFRWKFCYDRLFNTGIFYEILQ